MSSKRKVNVGPIPPNKMHLFFSGSGGFRAMPEHAIYGHDPDIMITFWEIDTKAFGADKRFERLKQQREDDAKN